MRAAVTAIAVSGLVAAAVVAESLESKVDGAVSRLRDDDTTALTTRPYADHPEAALAFLVRLDELEETGHRSRIVHFVRVLERSRVITATGPRGRSSDLKLALALARVMEKDPYPGVRDAAAEALRDLFLPADLDGCAQVIRDAARRWPEWRIMLLYASLPDGDLTEKTEILKAFKPTSPIDKLVDDSIRARWFADRQAEQRVIAALSHYSDLPWAASSLMALTVCDIVACTPTPAVKLALARGLRSEDMVEFAGGAAWPKRDLYAGALMRMMRDDPSFATVRHSGALFLGSDLDSLERWCTRHLGATYPAEPRKSLAARPTYPQVVPATASATAP